MQMMNAAGCSLNQRIVQVRRQKQVEYGHKPMVIPKLQAH